MARKLLRTPQDIRSILSQKYNRHVTTWLVQPELATYSLPLGTPTLHVAQNSPQKVQNWIDLWQEEINDFPHWNLQLMSPTWRNVEFTSIPARVTIMGPGIIADLLGKSDDWKLLRKRYSELYDRLATKNNESASIIASAMKKCLPEIRSCTDDDFTYVIDLAIWLRNNASSATHMRELMMSGQRWMMEHATFISILVEAARACSGLTGGRDIGITTPPDGMRWTYFLDESLRPAGIRSFMATIDQLAQLRLKPKVVLLCQSQYFLYAMPDLPDTIAIHTGTQDITAFAQLPWVREATVLYWGSIDTNNFGNVNQLRKHHPRVRTVLMDSSTLLKYEDMWDCETEASVERFPHLIPVERETCSFILQLGTSRYSTGEVQAYVKDMLTSWGTIHVETPMEMSISHQQLQERLGIMDMIGEPHIEDNTFVCAVRLDQDKLPWDEALPAVEKAVEYIVMRKKDRHITDDGNSAIGNAHDQVERSIEIHHTDDSAVSGDKDECGHNVTKIETAHGRFN
ncbi:MAG: DUF2220 family protein [Actinomycetaceae bacterium]|nr:DUF2220 family protein [Actinomycetaceae bacterium]